MPMTPWETAKSSRTPGSDKQHVLMINGMTYVYFYLSWHILELVAAPQCGRALPCAARLHGLPSLALSHAMSRVYFGQPFLVTRVNFNNTTVKQHCNRNTVNYFFFFYDGDCGVLIVFYDATHKIFSNGYRYTLPAMTSLARAWCLKV